MAGHTPETLRRFADECRKDILDMITVAGSGHPGGSLSVIDVVTYLYCREMKFDPKNAQWEDRDRFVLSKGHGVPAVYAVLAKLGAIPREELKTLRRIDSRLQGHPDRVALPFMEASTGSLGQGLSVAQGLAMGLRLARKTARVYCVLGDGETQEGQVWEAAMSSAKYKLGNLVAVTDCNNGQIDGTVKEVMDLEPLADKWRAFNWNVLDIDGHDFEAIAQAFDAARKVTDRPTMILARTVKGKGVSFMEGNIGWHGSAPSKEQYEKAIAELDTKLAGGGSR